MRILVCVKQVPDTLDAVFDEERGRLKRTCMPKTMNPYDRCALDAALEIKDKNENVKITVLSMGPKDADTVLKDALALGTDEAFLISDPQLEGSDVHGTVMTLTGAVRKLEDIQHDPFDLICCGERSVDGGTAYVAPALAYRLGRPFAARVMSCDPTDQGRLELVREDEDCVQWLETAFPCVVSFTKSDQPVRYPSVSGIIKAEMARIPRLNADDIYGTMPKREAASVIIRSISYHRLKKKSRIIREKDPEKAAFMLADLMRRGHLI